MKILKREKIEPILLYTNDTIILTIKLYDEISHFLFWKKQGKTLHELKHVVTADKPMTAIELLVIETEVNGKKAYGGLVVFE